MNIYIYKSQKLVFIDFYNLFEKLKEKIKNEIKI